MDYRYRTIISVCSLVISLQLCSQDTLDHRTILPAGITLGYGLGSYAVKDEYISTEPYTGTLPYYNVEWVHFKCKSGYRLQFEYRKTKNLSNNNISAEAQQFNFNQDFIFPVGSFSLFHRPIYAYLGPSIQVFYYEIYYQFAQPGTFISPSTYGVIGSMGFNAHFMYSLHRKFFIYALFRSNLLSVTSKKIDKQEYAESNTALLSPYRVNKLDLKLSLNYTPAKRISLSLGYIFDLSRINNWEPYIAASNSFAINLNLKF